MVSLLSAVSLLIVVLSVVVSTTTVVEGRPIVWTGLSGNTLWNEPRNWDVGSVPTAGDDVTINLLNTVANVLIGPPPNAVCNSLQVGGTSTFVQTLSVTGPINIGPGGGNLVGLGSITYDSAPDAAFATVGIFNGGSRFTFRSGTLSGPGAFTFANLTLEDPALKVFNTSVTTGLLYVDPGVGFSASFNIDNDNTLVVKDTLKTTQGITVTSVTAKSLFQVGTFSFAASTGATLTIRGTASINALNIGGGTGTLNDNVQVTAANVASGAVLQLIGSPTSQRTFGDITGGGSLQITGGYNVFNKATNIGTVTIASGELHANGDLSIVNLAASAGVISGAQTLTVSNAAFKNINLLNVVINVNDAVFSQFGTLDGSTVNVLGTASTDDVGQLVMANGASLAIQKNAKVSQTKVFRVLPTGDHPSEFTNNGQWSSSADLSLVVPTNGLGSFTFAQGATLQLTGIPFSASAVTLASAFFKTVGSSVVIGSLIGNGSVMTQGDSFQVLGTANAKSFVHQNGVTQMGSGTIDSLAVQVGTYNITGSGATVGSLSFTGGEITGAAGAGTILSVGDTTITGASAKTLSNILVTTSTLQLSCNAPQCQLFTSSASLTAKSSA